MFRPNIALQWALSVLFVLSQGCITTTQVQSLPFNDTVYLNREGNRIINKSRSSGKTVTFIVRTTMTKKELYEATPEEANAPDNGWSNYIDDTVANRIEQLIRDGKYKEAIQTKNLVQLRPLMERREDGKCMLQDDGKRNSTDNNNREYASAYYISIEQGHRIHPDTDRIEMRGLVFNPGTPKIEITLPCGPSIVRHTHSHPSGAIQIDSTSYPHLPQPPSGDDIHAASGRRNVVFGRWSNKVYIYDSTGVIAVLPTYAYLNY